MDELGWENIARDAERMTEITLARFKAIEPTLMELIKTRLSPP